MRWVREVQATGRHQAGYHTWTWNSGRKGQNRREKLFERICPKLIKILKDKFKMLRKHQVGRHTERKRSWKPTAATLLDQITS